MRITSDPASRSGRIAVLDTVDARILSRSGDAVRDWFRDGAAGRLSRRGDGAQGFEARFPDPVALESFVGRFLPGQLPVLANRERP